MGARATLADVGERAGVAPITCSRVLNGSKVRVYIAEPTRERVIEAARELGYRRSMTAGATRTGRVGAIGLVGIAAERALPRPLLWGVEEAAASRDVHLIIAQLRHREVETEAQLPRMLRESAVDGLVVFGLGNLEADSLLARKVRSLDVPVVHLGDDADVDCIRFDARSASTEATETLIRAGHQSVAFLQFAPMPGNLEFDVRDGYQRAMREAGLPTRSLIKPELRSRLDKQQAYAQQVLSRADRPAAIVASGSQEASAFVVAALRMGLRLPDDLALMAISGEQVQVGGLTVGTSLMPYGQMARSAVRMLCTKIDRPDRTMAPQILHHRMLPGQTA